MESRLKVYSSATSSQASKVKPYAKPTPKLVEIYGFVAVTRLVQIAGFDDRLGGAAKRTLMIIAGYSDQNGICFPSIKKMAGHLGISRQAITKQINSLIRYGYLVREANYSTSGRRTNNIYHLNLELAIDNQATPYIFSKGNVTS